MDWFTGEPTLKDTLADPIIRAVMERDNVELDDFRRFLDDIHGRLSLHAPCDDKREGLPR